MNRLTLLTAWLCLVTVLVFGSRSVIGQVRFSKHDLTAGGAAQTTTGLTTETCVFCHTPHGSTTGVNAPLWNKALPGTTYQRYSSLSSATLDGQEVAVGSVSLACLSCHDGTQAMDIVLNAPGSGGYNASGAELDIGFIGPMTGDPVPKLGADLRDDHPISIAYAGGACAGTVVDCDPSLAAAGDPDFAVAQYQLINGQDSWWVDTSVGTANQRDKTDMVLYKRDFSGTSGPAVECATCHDPHNRDSPNTAFMRISNNNSSVCLACHVK